jgi:hypothetical protein
VLDIAEASHDGRVSFSVSVARCFSSREANLG